MLTKNPLVFYLVANVLEQRSSTSITEIFLYSLHRKGGSIDSLNVSLKSVPRLLRHYSEQYQSLLPDPCMIPQVRYCTGTGISSVRTWLYINPLHLQDSNNVEYK